MSDVSVGGSGVWVGFSRFWFGVFSFFLFWWFGGLSCVCFVGADLRTSTPRLVALQDKSQTSYPTPTRCLPSPFPVPAGLSGLRSRS